MLETNRELIAHVTELGILLVKNSWKVVTVESCTGGDLSSALTSIPGASAWFEGGFVTYSNNAKIKLGVDASLIQKYGAVSTAVAEAMAIAALTFSNADVCVSTTGFAGPRDGSENKPVGTVFIGYATTDSVYSEEHIFEGKRADIRHAGVITCIKGLAAICTSR